MDFISVVLIAIGLSADCFAVGVSGSMSLKNTSRLQILRASLAFGFSQAIMPVLGWLAGRAFADLIASYDHWVAFILLVFIGARMIWESFRAKDGRTETPDITRGWLLLILSLATSIDALVVGLSFAFLAVNIVLASSTIGVVAFTATAIAFSVGTKMGKFIGRRAEVIGGLVLIAIGLRILISHIT